MIKNRISSIRKIKSLSYWRYVRLKKCELSGAFPHAVGGMNHRSPPPGKAQVLGILFHSLFEKLNRHGDPRDPALFRDHFNSVLQEYSEKPIGDTLSRHLGDLRNWPETASLYRDLREVVCDRQIRSKTNCKVFSEETIYSTDGLLFGQIDAIFIDENGIDLIDYKSGQMIDADLNPKEEYVEQLYFYAYLVKQRFGQYPKTLSLIGRDASVIQIIPDEHRSEELAQIMRAVLQAYNVKIDRGDALESFATASVQNCLYCDAKPYCSKFWSSSADLHVSDRNHCILGKQSGIFHKSRSGPLSIELVNIQGTIQFSEAKVTRVMEGRFPWIKDLPGQLLVFVDVKLLSRASHGLFELTERSIILTEEVSGGVQ